MSALSAWSAFFAMTGSSAAALTGLMFVVITLSAGDARLRTTRQGLSTFSTPTVLHFVAAFLVSAILCAPWHLAIHPAVLLGLGGLAGLIYIGRVAHLTRRLDGYTADAEDWLWFTIVPFVAYGAILGGAVALPAATDTALFVSAGGAVLLIFIGIRNAWDVVTYLALRGQDEEPEPADDLRD